MKRNAPQHIVVMGVCGCGKSTIAERLAARLSLPFAEADTFHPQANIDKMAQGIALEDDDRWPWLASLRDWMSEQVATGSVVTCSALKRGYRDLLREAQGEVYFVLLHGSRALLASRLGGRSGHFMPSSLLDSQLNTLELPQPDEPVATFDIALPADVLLEQIVEHLNASTRVC